MSDKDASTPRVFLIRHGETEWSRNGRYTGNTDLPLLPEGENRVKATAKVVFGPGKLIDPRKLVHVFSSPRQRAQKTWQLYTAVANESSTTETRVETTEEIREWTYGAYEGLLTHQIRDLRKSHGLDLERPWDIWRDGCEDGESAAEVSERLDRLIGQITGIQGKGMEENKACNVVVVAHGHILRAFVKRWLGFALDAHMEMMLEPGGVCGLSYAHGNIKERAVLVGMSFPS